MAGGAKFWTLVPFTMQMAMIIIGGYVVASTPAVYWIIQQSCPNSQRIGKTAVAWIAFFSMLTSLISWGLSLIFSGLLVREMTRRLDDMDFRAAGAAAYLGLGATWALGLSSSAAMMMASKDSIPKELFQISGLIPLTHTLFMWANLSTIAVLMILAVANRLLVRAEPQAGENCQRFRPLFRST